MWVYFNVPEAEYLDFKRGAAMKEAITAITGNGLQKKFLLLLTKSVVGRKLIKKIR